MAKGETAVEREKDWESENACDTLIRAEEIRNKPSLLKKATAVMEKRKKALNEALELSPDMQTRLKRRKQL